MLYNVFVKHDILGETPMSFIKKKDEFSWSWGETSESNGKPQSMWSQVKKLKEILKKAGLC